MNGAYSVSPQVFKFESEAGHWIENHRAVASCDAARASDNG